MQDELRDAVLLVFANKQDLPNAMNAAEITDKLGLHSLKQRHWYSLSAAHKHLISACLTVSERQRGQKPSDRKAIYHPLVHLCIVVVMEFA